MSIVSGVLVRFELKFVTDLIVLPTIIEKEKKCSFSFIQISFWNVYFCLKSCQYISTHFVEVTPMALNIFS